MEYSAVDLPADFELPALPRTTQLLLPLLQQDDEDLAAVVQAIELDPALAARVIGVARSAYYGSQRNIYSVRDAVVRCIGLDMVWNLALGISLAGVFETRKCPVFNVERYWQSAVGASEVSKVWAQAFPQLGINPELAHLTGLLHNLGLLALVYLYPARLQRVLQAHEAQPQEPLAEWVRADMGTDHHEVGAALASRWGLPRASAAVMCHWHDQDCPDEYAVLCKLVRSAVIGGRVLRGREPENTLRELCAPAMGVDADGLVRTLDPVAQRWKALNQLAAGMSGSR